MRITIQITDQPIVRPDPGPATSGGRVGAWVEFTGVVRGSEHGQLITALEYEAYLTMAQSMIRQILEDLAARHPCESAWVIHRIGVVPVGEAPIWIGVGAAHREPALLMVAEFMNRLKQDVPIWKHRALTTAETGTNSV